MTDDAPQPQRAPQENLPRTKRWPWLALYLSVVAPAYLAFLAGGMPWGSALFATFFLALWLGLMVLRFRSWLRRSKTPAWSIDDLAYAQRAALKRHRMEEEQRAYARVMRSLHGAPPPPAPEAPLSPLAAFARARGFHVESPRAIAGDRAGVRIAIERSGDDDDANVSLVVDAQHATAETLDSLRERLAPSGYALVRVGPNVRVEWREKDAVELDADRLDETLGAVVEACAPGRDGGYR